MGTWYVWSLTMSAIATTFFFSRLWRRARVVTDAELIKYRYSGKIGNALRIFKASISASSSTASSWAGSSAR